MFSLDGKVVCITGVTSGIGEACAHAFAQAKAKLIVCGRREQKLAEVYEQLQSKYGCEIYSAPLDVREMTGVESFFSSLPAAWQTIDVLINNAGLARGVEKIQDGTPADWDEMIDTNVKGLLYVTHAVLPGMVKRNSGHIINIGSSAGHWVYPGGGVYCATKYSVGALTEALKADLLGTDVRVSIVSPGRVRTEFIQVRYKGDPTKNSIYDESVPLLPSDVADAVLYCATRPKHVNINEILMMPVLQAGATVAKKG